VDEAALPYDGVQPVTDTPFDFRTARPIHAKAGAKDQAFPYDHCFILSSPIGADGLRRAARLSGARQDLAMELWTNQPAVQFYAGHKIKTTIPGHQGHNYNAFSGLCLEPQIPPDSPNGPFREHAILRPGEDYHQISEFRFYPL
jgi:aldose 1-epimerase